MDELLDSPRIESPRATSFNSKRVSLQIIRLSKSSTEPNIPLNLDLSPVFKSSSTGGIVDSPSSQRRRDRELENLVHLGFKRPLSSGRKLLLLRTIVRSEDSKITPLLFKLDFLFKKEEITSCKAFSERVMSPYLHRYKVSAKKQFVLNMLLSMHKQHPGYEIQNDQISIESLLNTYSLVVDARSLFQRIHRALKELEKQITASTENPAPPPESLMFSAKPRDLTGDVDSCDLERVQVQYLLILEFILLWLRSDHNKPEVTNPKLLTAIKKLLVGRIIPLIEKRNFESAEVIKGLLEQSSQKSGFLGIIPIDVTNKWAIDDCLHDLNNVSADLVKKLALPDMLKKPTTDSQSVSTWQEIIDHNNQLAQWVSYSLLRGLTDIDVGLDTFSPLFGNKKNCSTLVDFFSTLALRCIRARNFDTALSIYYGLNQVSIMHLKLEPSKRYLELEKICSLSNNQKNLRAAVEKTDKTLFHTLPSQLFSKDLTSIRENSIVVDGEYHTRPLNRISRKLEEVEKMKEASLAFQQTPYRTSLGIMIKTLVEYDDDLDVLFAKMAAQIVGD